MKPSPGQLLLITLAAGLLLMSTCATGSLPVLAGLSLFGLALTGVAVGTIWSLLEWYARAAPAAGPPAIWVVALSVAGLAGTTVGFVVMVEQFWDADAVNWPMGVAAWLFWQGLALVCGLAGVLIRRHTMTARASSRRGRLADRDDDPPSGAGA